MPGRSLGSALSPVPVIRRVLRAYDVSFEGPDARGAPPGVPDMGVVWADLFRHAATFLAANPDALLEGVHVGEVDGASVLTLYFGDQGRDLDEQLTHDVHVGVDPPA